MLLLLLIGFVILTVGYIHRYWFWDSAGNPRNPNSGRKPMFRLEENLHPDPVINRKLNNRRGAPVHLVCGWPFWEDGEPVHAGWRILDHETGIWWEAPTRYNDSPTFYEPPELKVAQLIVPVGVRSVEPRPGPHRSLDDLHAQRRPADETAIYPSEAETVWQR